MNMFSKVFGLFLLFTWCHVGHASFFEPGCRTEIQELLQQKQLKLYNSLNMLDKKTDKQMFRIEQEIADVKAKVNNLIHDYTVPKASGPCPNGWVVFEGSCYYISQDKMDFDKAKDACESERANLVEIDTDEEFEFIKSQIKEDGGDHFWIGITDQKQEGVWVFADSGLPVSLLEWGNKQPNNGRVSNCGAIWKSFNYYFVDEPCKNKFQPVCEK